MSATGSLLFAMAATLAVWAGLLLLTAGLGGGMLRLALGQEAARAATDLPLRAWTGFAGVIAFLQLWHFFLPVDGRALAALVLAALAGWRCASRPRIGAPPAAIALFAALAVWIANRAIGPCLNFDSANYHLPLISWFRDYPLPPGLANLNPLYGLNLAGLLFPALLEAGPGRGRSSHFGNGFLLVLLLALLVRQLSVTWRERRASGAADWAAALLLFPAVGRITANGGYWLTSPATDMPPLFAGCAALVLGLGALDASRPSPERQARLVGALALSAVLPALKSTALVWAAATFAVWALLALRRFPAGPRRPLAAATAFAAVAMGSWLLRGVLLSGYPFFPLRWLSPAVAWRLPGEYADGVYWWAQVWARTAGDTRHWVELQDGFAWLPHWVRTELRPGLEEILVPLGLGLAVLALALLRRARAGVSIWLLVPPLVALPVWFLATPSARFGQLLFWSLAATVAAGFLPNLFVRRRWLVLGAALCAVAPLALQSYYALRFRGPIGVGDALARLALTKAGPDHGFHPLVEPMLERVPACGGGFEVWQPRKGFEADEKANWPVMLLWAAAPPATTFALHDLCPRRPGDLSRGFRPLAATTAGWPAHYATQVRSARARTGWDEGRLAVHFSVRPELIRRALDSAE